MLLLIRKYLLPIQEVLFQDRPEGGPYQITVPQHNPKNTLVAEIFEKQILITVQREVENKGSLKKEEGGGGGEKGTTHHSWFKNERKTEKKKRVSR